MTRTVFILRGKIDRFEPGYDADLAGAIQGVFATEAEAVAWQEKLEPFWEGVTEIVEFGLLGEL